MTQMKTTISTQVSSTLARRKSPELKSRRTRRAQPFSKKLPCEGVCCNGSTCSPKPWELLSAPSAQGKPGKNPEKTKLYKPAPRESTPGGLVISFCTV